MNKSQTTGDFERDQNREDINTVKKSVRASKARNFIVGANMLLLGAMGNANAAETQSKLQNQQKVEAKVTASSPYDDVVVPEQHSAAHPFELLNTGTTDGLTTRKVGVMGGGAVITLLPGNPGTQYVASPDGRSFTSQTVNFDKPGNRYVEYNDGSSSSNKIITVNITWQARIKNGDVAFVAPGETVKLSVGTNMANHKWTDLGNSTSLGQGKGDSTKIVTQGTYEARTVDGSGLTTGSTRDTIAVVERPVANNNTKTLEFTKTVPGVIYKVYKLNKDLVQGTDSTKAWVETMSFVGDGNAYTANTGIGLHKIGAIRKAGVDVNGMPIQEVKDNAKIDVSFGTEVYEITEKVEPTFVVNGRTLYFKEDVKYQIIDMSGCIIKTGKGNMESVPQAGSYIVMIQKTNGKKIYYKLLSD